MESIKKVAEIIHPGYFESETDGRRWEFDFKNEQIVTYKREVDLLFIGDSITHIWELNANFRSFGFVVNRGIGGDRLQYLSRRFMADAVQLKPRLTVLLIGVNNTWDVCDEKATDQTAEDVYQLVMTNYRQILNMAKENGMAMIVCLVQPVRTNCPAQDKLIVHMNEGITALCEEFGVKYVDYYKEMVAEDGHTYPELYSQDGLHPMQSAIIK